LAPDFRPIDQPVSPRPTCFTRPEASSIFARLARRLQFLAEHFERVAPLRKLLGLCRAHRISLGVDTRTHPRPPNFSRRRFAAPAGTTSTSSASQLPCQPRRDWDIIQSSIAARIATAAPMITGTVDRGGSPWNGYPGDTTAQSTVPVIIGAAVAILAAIEFWMMSQIPPRLTTAPAERLRTFEVSLRRVQRREKNWAGGDACGVSSAEEDAMKARQSPAICGVVPRARSARQKLKSTSKTRKMLLRLRARKARGPRRYRLIDGGRKSRPKKLAKPGV